MKLAAELKRVRAQAQNLSAKIDEIDGRLRSAVAFVPALKEWLDAVDFEDDVALTDAIVAVLKRKPTGRMVPRDEIRRQLPTVGYSSAKLAANPNYFYIALKRLVERGLIVEGAPTGRFALKQ